MALFVSANFTSSRSRMTFFNISLEGNNVLFNICLSALLLTVQNNPLTTYGPKLQLMSCCRVIKIIEMLYIAAL